MTIQDYVKNAKRIQLELYRGQSAAEVLMKKYQPNIDNWSVVFKKGGYHLVIPRSANWQDMHYWLAINIGKEHYTWNGNNFWFETEEAAAWFALKWA